jgi:excisionase family DNA binding protein
MPLLSGWASTDRTLFHHLIGYIDEAEKRRRVDGIALPPSVLKARVEMNAFVKRGGTASNAVSSHSELGGTQTEANNTQIGNLDTAELAQILHISDRAVRKKCQNEEIPATKVGRSWKIPSWAVESMR